MEWARWRCYAPAGSPTPLTGSGRRESKLEALHRPPRRRLQQFLQLPLPELRHSGGAVAARLLAARYQVKPPVLDALELALHDAELRRIALVVGGIDRQQRGLDALQAGRRVVVARRFP